MTRNPGNVPGQSLSAMAEKLQKLQGWRRYLVAALFGASGVLAMAPFGFWPFLLFSYAGLYVLLSGAGSMRRGALCGFFHAYGFHVAGLFWIAEAFFVDADRYALLSPLPVLGLPLILALFQALASAFFIWLRPRGWLFASLTFAMALGVGEWARGALFTGFPWNAPGYGWAGSEAMMQFAALFGATGLGVLSLFAAALLGEAACRRRPMPLLVAAGLLLTVFAGGLWRLYGAESAVWPGIRLRIVQANVPQKEKWARETRFAHFSRQFQISSLPGEKPVTHLVWPETAAPYDLGLSLGPRRLVGEAAAALPGGLVLTGAIRREGSGGVRRIFNSLFAIAPGGEIAGIYDKRHLVPFGEYLPFRSLLRSVGLEALAAEGGDFSPGGGDAVMRLPGLPPVRPLICYEAVFPAEVSVTGRPMAWLLNITNDAWFGEWAGPYQHFAISRFRAVEQGVPLVRAANTGISAFVDPYGRVISSLGLGRSGFIDGDLPKPLPLTGYARWGEWPISLLLSGLAALAFWRRIRAGL